MTRRKNSKKPTVEQEDSGAPWTMVESKSTKRARQQGINIQPSPFHGINLPNHDLSIPIYITNHGSSTDVLLESIEQTHANITKEKKIIRRPRTITSNFNAVPQSQPMSVDQVVNSAGGFTFQVTDMQQLKRFLCIGCESGTYYVSERDLKVTNILALKNLVDAGRGPEAVATIRQFSVEGRTAKQDGLLTALALCAHSSDAATKQAAFACLSDVCRIPTHLFQFVEISERVCAPRTGWGRAQRRAVASWYLKFAESPGRLAYLVTKYRQRGGWSHKDLLRLCHAKCDRSQHPRLDCVLKFCVKGLDAARAAWPSGDCEMADGGGDNNGSVDDGNLLAFLEATEQVREMTAGCEYAAVPIIEQHRLVREHVPAPLLGANIVMAALLRHMPMTALLRSLGKLLASGLFTEQPDLLDRAIEQLTNADQLRKALVHPISVLAAWRIVSAGKGFRGKLNWRPEPRLVSALEKAFYLSFANVQPTGKRYLLAIDVSGSMSAPANPIQCISCAEASAALAMVVARTEPETSMIVGFSSGLKDLGIRATDSLEVALKKCHENNFGSTDCALPMMWAAKKRKPFDVFVVLTDNETYFGKVHPHKALVDYRKTMGLPDARLVVMAMTANKFSIADPGDPGMLDMVGFDPTVPEILRSFALGEF